MNIVQFADETWDSGLTEYALTLTAALTERGHKCWFMALDGSHAHKRALRLGLNTIAVRKTPGGYLSALKKLREIKPDIINAHTGSSHSFAVLLALGLARTAVVRTRADARDFRLKPFASLLWGRTAGFIAANNFILTQFKAALGGQVPAALIMQGIYAPDTPVTAAEGKKIGIVARLDPVKGHSVALAAMTQVLKSHPDAKLLIAGEDKNITAAQLRAQAEKLGIYGNVEFYGRLADVYAFMDDCAVGLIPSLGSEAVSRGALEWMSRARPVIASTVGGLADFVKDGETGLLVPPDNPSALAAAINTYLSNPALAKTAGERGRASFERSFTPQAFAEATENFYRKVTG